MYEVPYSQRDWQGNIENTQWLELFHPFTAAKNLYLSEEFVPRIALALEGFGGGGGGAEVLPNLQNVFLEGLQPLGPSQKGIRQFIVARQAAGHPVAVYPWDRRGAL